VTAKRISKKLPKRAARNEWLAIVEELNQLMANLVSVEEALPPTRKKSAGLDKRTLAVLNEAYSATLRYYSRLLGGGSRDPQWQTKISRLWQEAGRQIRKRDPALAARFRASNTFWSEDVTWSEPTIQKAWAGLNAIRVSANMMDPDVNGVRRWSTFSAS
jgi:hypothetical protein